MDDVSMAWVNSLLIQTKISSFSVAGNSMEISKAEGI